MYDPKHAWDNIPHTHVDSDLPTISLPRYHLSTTLRVPFMIAVLPRQRCWEGAVEIEDGVDDDQDVIDGEEHVQEAEWDADAAEQGTDVPERQRTSAGVLTHHLLHGHQR